MGSLSYQETSFTKLSFREMPALTSKMEEDLQVTKSVETSGSWAPSEEIGGWPAQLTGECPSAPLELASCTSDKCQHHHTGGSRGSNHLILSPVKHALHRAGRGLGKAKSSQQRVLLKAKRPITTPTFGFPTNLHQIRPP